MGKNNKLFGFSAYSWGGQKKSPLRCGPFGKNEIYLHNLIHDKVGQLSCQSLSANGKTFEVGCSKCGGFEKKLLHTFEAAQPAGFAASTFQVSKTWKRFADAGQAGWPCGIAALRIPQGWSPAKNTGKFFSKKLSILNNLPLRFRKPQRFFMN